MRAQREAKGDHLAVVSGRTRCDPVKAESPAGRNEPCDCGSGRKHKKCCLVDPAKKLAKLQAECKHPEELRVPTHGEVWDDNKHQGLDADEVRRIFPRQRCRGCRTEIYRSYGHYIAGDW